MVATTIVANVAAAFAFIVIVVVVITKGFVVVTAAAFAAAFRDGWSWHYFPTTSSIAVASIVAVVRAAAVAHGLQQRF